MTESTYTLARLSLGQEGKTAYYWFPSTSDMPKKLSHTWENGKTTTHTKTVIITQPQTTSEVWWKKHVRNKEFPGHRLIEDLFQDVFEPLHTVVLKYALDPT